MSVAYRLLLIFSRKYTPEFDTHTNGGIDFCENINCNECPAETICDQHYTDWIPAITEEERDKFIAKFPEKLV